MKSRHRNIVIALCGAFLLSAPGISAETFRGSIAGFAATAPGATYSVELGAGDVLIIPPTPDQPFVRGYEIALNVPPGDPGFVGNYAIAIYKRVDAPNFSGPASIIGTRMESIVLTAGGRQFLIVPFATAERTPASSADTRILDSIDRQQDLPVAIQLVPVMKGMSSAAATARLPVQVRSLAATIGGVVVEVASGSNDIDPSSVRIKIDGWPVEPGKVVELEPGIYSVSLQSPDAVDEVRNVGVEAGKLTRVSFSLRRPMASVRLSVPTVAQVLVDGRPVTNGSLSVTPGEHTLLIRLGDYAVSRRVLLEGETDYEIGLSLDIFVRKD